MNKPPFSARNRLTVAAAILLLTGTLSAGMTLDTGASTVSLLSTKVLADGSQSVMERHAFTRVDGTVSEDGSATITIPLDSLETNIPIRNERLAEFLFETAQYPEAVITAQVPPEMLVKGFHTGLLDAKLSLHGETRLLSIPVRIHSTGQKVVVTALEPVMLDASAFNLDGGIARLQELAKLMHITTTVPVSFSLTFTQSSS